MSKNNLIISAKASWNVKITIVTNRQDPADIKKPKSLLLKNNEEI